MINRIKLKNKLILVFILFSITTISLVSIINRVYVEHNFNKYAQNKMEKNKQETYEKIKTTYKNGKWDKNKINFIGYNALEDGLIISIKEKSGDTVWDAREFNNLECEIALAKNRYNANKINPDYNNINTKEKLSIKIDEKIVGDLNLEYIGPLYFEDSDVIFFEMLNGTLFILSCVFLVFSIIFGILVSSSLSKPILKVINATNLISKENYSNKILEKSNIEEINQLIISVNKMATNIEHQANLRKIMTRDISHELRTPLTTMQAQLEAIIDGLWEPTQKRLGSIHEELQRLSRLVSSFEELFKYDDGEIKLNKENVDISSILYPVLINFEKDFLDNNIKLEMNIKKCNAFIDKDKIRQVVINIISNSIKYTNSDGKIIVNCYEDHDNVFIDIKDSGIGINEEDLKNIFERFYRADKSRNKDSGGLGVGLTISKAIVDAHNGQINVESSVGKGSTFTIYLPKMIKKTSLQKYAEFHPINL